MLIDHNLMNKIEILLLIQIMVNNYLIILENYLNNQDNNLFYLHLNLLHLQMEFYIHLKYFHEILIQFLLNKIKVYYHFHFNLKNSFFIYKLIN